MNVTPSLWQSVHCTLSLCEGEQAEWYRTGSVKLSGIITTHCGPACWSSSSNLLWSYLSTAINRFYALSPWVVHSCCCIHSLPNDCVTASPIFSSETMGWSSRTLEWSCLWEVCCTSWVRRFHADAADCKFKTKNQKKNGKYFDVGPYLTQGDFKVVLFVLRSVSSIYNFNESYSPTPHFTPSLLGHFYVLPFQV